MPEISKNEIAILKSNRGKKLIRIDSVCMRMYSGWNFSRTTDQAAMDSSTKTILHEVHEGHQYAHIANFVQMNFETDQSSGTFFMVCQS